MSIGVTNFCYTSRFHCPTRYGLTTMYARVLFVMCLSVTVTAGIPFCARVCLKLFDVCQSATGRTCTQRRVYGLQGKSGVEFTAYCLPLCVCARQVGDVQTWYDSMKFSVLVCARTRPTDVLLRDWASRAVGIIGIETNIFSYAARYSPSVLACYITKSARLCQELMPRIRLIAARNTRSTF